MNTSTKGLCKSTDFYLFSGCGGLTVGLKRAGFKVLVAVDIDPLSNETYRANHKDVKVWEIDIVDRREMARAFSLYQKP